ncbi:MAG: sulfite exporter TauE/SafE family protein [Pseudomonadales bacterium]|nr:sulfite exporter TauE/SafE family protein [Pseudomonadales bacterium]
MNLWVIFLTGLTTGGLSCLAMQGGLLTSIIANQKDREFDESISDKDKDKKNKRKKYAKTLQQSNFSLKSFDDLDWMPVGMFLLTKVVAHVILGFLLGWLGSTLSLSLGVRLVFQVFTALFMFGTAMNLLDVHPIFRYMVFQPPKFIQKIVRNSTKSKALFAPALLGFLTVFIPCGITQAMEVLAISSGNPFLGALIMFSFILGTTPLFAIIGIATAKLSEGWHEKFMKFAAVVLIGMAIYSINGVLIVMDSSFTINKLVSPITYFFSDDRFANSLDLASITNGVQKINIKALSSGYSPNYVVVKSGVPVELTVSTNDTYSCASAFIFKEFGISVFLKPTDSQTFMFTPTKRGKFTYSCSMGMYTGILEVI